MLERHQPPSVSMWSVNNLWFAFLFLCLCWVAIMVLIIHREILNQSQLTRLFNERAEVAIQMIPLSESDVQSEDYEALRHRMEMLNSRIQSVQSPPTTLFVVFSLFEALFIVGFYVLLWRLRGQIPGLALRVYLATLPLGFVYFFFTTFWGFEGQPWLLGNTQTLVVVLYFALGMVVVGAQAIFLSGKAERQSITSDS